MRVSFDCRELSCPKCGEEVILATCLEKIWVFRGSLCPQVP